MGSFWNDYGYGGGYPHNVLFDRDGNIRKYKVGAILGGTVAEWETIIQQLCGAS